MPLLVQPVIAIIVFVHPTRYFKIYWDSTAWTS
ncbi:hypothetical protein SAMN05216191_104194 [Paenibacillus jilunlii]|uniref:Uncharacterized protein n=1 Tax=Paenibacillus jilunlii TaxID=682956 RepID=A0A1G9LQW2_9BACL|nr:hypothetical protein SAMN05216191_104194 [Paenibacillus jilunlii]